MEFFVAQLLNESKNQNSNSSQQPTPYLREN